MLVRRLLTQSLTEELVNYTKRLPWAFGCTLRRFAWLHYDGSQPIPLALSRVPAYVGFAKSAAAFATPTADSLALCVQMALNTCCMAMCTLILASIFRTYTAMLSEEEEANYIMQCREFARG